ncbi:MAG: hypothetical protein AB7D36_05615 [Oscillospiraceae bacterium]
MIAKVRCVQCGKICADADRIYQVRIIDGEGQKTYAPACSFDCAYATKIKYAMLHQNRVDLIERQSFQIMKVSDYLGGETE